MFLNWLGVAASSVSELLWYLHVSPPPQTNSTVTQQPVSVNIKSETSGNLVVSTHSPTLPEVTVPKCSTPPSMFALIIGINKYKDPDVGDLYGAVPDADAVRDFLTEIGVSKDRIVNLRDEDATRDTMMNAIKDLARNPSISNEDPILIFYAGHGAETPSPITKWQPSNPNGKVQMLVPHDFAWGGSNDNEGQGIFDFTLSKYLADIARNKSDNITVILDSCYSGSGTRLPNQRDKTSISRGIDLHSEYKIPTDIYVSENDRANSVSSGYERVGLNSHVLLAACTQGQKARERRGRGAFTSELLSLLQEQGTDQLTYQDVINRLPELPLQDPQCEGPNKNRILFKSKVPSPYRPVYRIHSDSNRPGEYTVEAGEAHRITNQAEFAVYSDRRMITFVGSVVACDTTPFSSRCFAAGNIPFSLTESAYAVQTRAGQRQDISLLIEANDAFLDLFKQIGREMQRNDNQKRSYRLVDNIGEKPDLMLTVKNGLVQFHVMEKICRQYGLQKMPFNDIRVDESQYLITILRSAADFYWNLHHSNGLDKGKLLPFITLECLKLVESGYYTDELVEILQPEPGRQNLNACGTIVIDVEEPVKFYGFSITNGSQVPLYAALFYFDVSDLSIVQYYTPGAAANGRVEFSLPANGCLNIGFGDSGTNPCVYFLREGQSVDVGFLKLYLSTEYINYSNIAQSSPFQPNRANKLVEPKRRHIWDTLIIPIIQQKGAASGRGFEIDGSRNSGTISGPSFGTVV